MIKTTCYQNTTLKPLFSEKPKAKEDKPFMKVSKIFARGAFKSVSLVKGMISGTQSLIKTLSPQTFPEWFFSGAAIASIKQAKTDGLKCATYIPFSALLTQGPQALYDTLIKDKPWSYFLSLSMEDRQSFIYDLYTKARALSSDQGPQMILDHMKSFSKTLDLSSLADAVKDLADTNPEAYNKALELTKEGLVSKLSTSTEELASKLGSSEAASELLSKIGGSIRGAESFISLQAALEDVAHDIDTSDIQELVLNTIQEKQGFLKNVFDNVVDFLTSDEKEAFQLQASASCDRLASDYNFALFYLGIFAGFVGFRVLSSYCTKDSKANNENDRVTQEQFKETMQTFQSNIQQLFAEQKKHQEMKLEAIQNRIYGTTSPIQAPKSIDQKQLMIDLLKAVRAQKLALKQRQFETPLIKAK